MKRLAFLIRSKIILQNFEAGRIQVAKTNQDVIGNREHTSLHCSPFDNPRGRIQDYSTHWVSKILGYVC